MPSPYSLAEQYKAIHQAKVHRDWDLRMYIHTYIPFISLLITLKVGPYCLLKFTRSGSGRGLVAQML